MRFPASRRSSSDRPVATMISESPSPSKSLTVASVRTTGEAVEGWLQIKAANDTELVSWSRLAVPTRRQRSHPRCDPCQRMSLAVRLRVWLRHSPFHQAAREWRKRRGTELPFAYQRPPTAAPSLLRIALAPRAAAAPRPSRLCRSSPSRSPLSASYGVSGFRGNLARRPSRRCPVLRSTGSSDRPPP